MSDLTTWPRRLGIPCALCILLAIASLGGSVSIAAGAPDRHDLNAVRSTMEVFGSYLRASERYSLDPEEIERFISDHAAVVVKDDGPALVESTLPLRAESGDGHIAPVNLDLVRRGEEWRPEVSPVPIEIPRNLGDGIALPAQGLTLGVPNADPDVEPIIIRKSIAIYPLAEPATSFVTIPLPTGLETFSVLHRPAAEGTQEFDLQLPAGATLRPTPAGGAEVLLSGRVLLSVSAPTAIDASGAPVATSLEVRGETLRVQVLPMFGNSYPILVDPVYQTYNWASGTSAGISDWTKYSNTSAYIPAAQLECGTNCVSPWEKGGTPGLYVGAGSGSVSAGSSAYWSYFVPRYQSDKSKYGQLPSSYISSAEFSSVMFFHRSDAAASPVLFAGIWSGTEAPYWGGPNYWVSQESRAGNQADWTNSSFTLSNGSSKQSAKWLLAGLSAIDSHAVSSYRDAYFGAVKVSLSDSAGPVINSITSPTGWYDQLATSITPMTVEDTGLGVASFTSKETVSPFKSWVYSLGCPGTAGSPCPRVWNSSEGNPSLLTWPSALPEGISNLAVTASDPVGNNSPASYVEVKVDHSAPNVSLSGPLTDPGAKRLDPGEYPLNISATDGTLEKPRSGVKSIAIEVDGKVVPGTLEQACPAGSCAASRSWTFSVTGYANGIHTVKVIVKDQVGHQSISELKVTVDKGQIYWGSWIDGDVALMPREAKKAEEEGKEVTPRGDAPWDEQSWKLFEEHAGGKKTSIVHFGQPPPWILHSQEGSYFQKGPLELARKHGAIAMMDMRSDAKSFGVHVSLDQIATGSVDDEIEEWAKTVKAYGRPFFLRWDWEMNLTGNEFIWAQEAAEEPSDYVAAWRHFYDLATKAVGATNVTWVWCPNVKYSGSTPISELWPGGEYVDWTCMDGYNWGTNVLQPDTWKSLNSVFGPTYDELLTFAPSKPIMIGETASTESGGNKAEWITNALTKELPGSLPKVKAFVWFNWNAEKGTGRMDWPIESSIVAEEAFAAGIGSPNYAAGGAAFENLPVLTPIQPLP